LPRAQSFHVVLDGTNPVFLPLSNPMSNLEVSPGGVVTVQMRLGDGVDDVPLVNGRSYASPSGVMVKPLRLRLMAASATTADVIAWEA